MGKEEHPDHTDKLLRFFLFLDEIVNSLVYQITTVIIIRSLMILISGIFLNTVICYFNNLSYLGFIAPIIMISVDAAFLCLIRGGNEFTWF